MTNTSKPKCVVLANSAWNIYNFRISLIQALKKDFDVWVMAQDLEKRDDLEGVQIVPLFYLDADSVNPFKAFKAKTELRNRLIGIQPDVVISFTLKPSVLTAPICESLNIPFISVVTGLGQIFIRDSFRNRLLRHFVSTSLSKSTKIIVQNKEDQEKLGDMGLAVPIEVIKGSGVNTEYFSPIQNTLYTYDFLFMGRCMLEKGIIELKEAHAILNEGNVKVRIGICGPWIEGDKRYVDGEAWNLWQNELGVEYLGALNDVRPAIASTRCVVLPSYREGLSKALLESMSMGVPILTTDVPGCSSLVKNGETGWIVPSRNAKALADKMEKIMKTEDSQVHEKGRNAREVVLSQYDEKVIIPKYISAMKELVR